MDKIIITAIGLAAVAGVVWFFWGPRHGGTEATSSQSGFQDATIAVRGGYVPDTVIVHAGRPVRLHFLRQESSPCSETVVFPDFNTSARLPQGETVVVELRPLQPGTFEFGCAMGMIHGRMVVR